MALCQAYIGKCIRKIPCNLEERDRVTKRPQSAAFFDSLKRAVRGQPVDSVFGGILSDSEKIQHIVQIDFLPDLQLVFGFRQVIEQNSSTSALPSPRRSILK